MRVLALDSSGIVASVAVVEDDTLVAEYTVNYKKTHSQTLLPMLDEIVKMTELDLKTIDAIAVAKGPGSFTGLRIGSATAKGLIMDARRKQVYTGIYRYEDHRLVTVKDQMAVGIEELLSMLNEMGETVTFLGDGVPVFKDIIADKLEVPFSFAPAHLSRQRAGAVGALGILYYKEGRTETAAEHKPDYLRVSQAERERAQKLKKESEGENA